MEKPINYKSFGDSGIKVTEEGISYDAWVKRGMLKIRRDALDPYDPDYLYNYLSSYGIIPENYGIIHPIQEEFCDHSREELLNTIVSLRKELDSALRWL